jgi:hypothetical protein
MDCGGWTAAVAALRMRFHHRREEFMTLRVGLAAIFLLSLCAASPSFGASPACDPGPSQADIDACTPEVYAHCNEFVPDEAAITQCLKKNISLLKAPCRKVMTRPMPKVRLPRCQANNN